MRIAPLDVQLIGSELAVKWSDGKESFLPLETLRLACPCAACGGEPDLLGHVARPQSSYSEKSFDLKSWQIIGGYALQPQWGDGHNTGIFSFDYLRRLAANIEEKHP